MRSCRLAVARSGVVTAVVLMVLSLGAVTDLAAAVTWSLVDPMSTGRAAHTATLLLDGRVLVAGGGLSPTEAIAEIYDPATDGWSPTGALNTARYAHAATRLADGRVLVAGGLSSGGGSLASAEIYDPANGTWTTTGSMTTARFGYTAVLLLDGRVLAIGGYDGSSLASTEIYDPVGGTWAATGSMTTERDGYTATLLSDGRVLVAGGWKGSAFSSAEIYDPAAGTWSLTGSMSTPRVDHTATLLSHDRVLVTGGMDVNFLASSEIYDSATGTWSTTGSLNVARRFHEAALRSDGRVVIAGGYDGGFLAGAEIYDPTLGTWSPAGSMTIARISHTATPLADGRVLVAGGSGFDTASAEVSSAPQDQTITFAPLPDKTFGAADFTVSATASSGLPVGFAASGRCTVTGAVVHLTGVGSCTITASQPGDADFHPAPEVPRAFNIIARPMLTARTPTLGRITSSPGGINCPGDCTQAYAVGTTVTLTARPDTGMGVAGWGDACIAFKGATCVVVMDSAKTVSAQFGPVLSARRVGSGSIMSVPAGIDCPAVRCDKAFVKNTSVRLSATAAQGFAFTRWAGACTGSAACVVSMTVSKTVTATFTALPTYRLSLGRSGGGRVTSVPAGIDCGIGCAQDTGDYVRNTRATLTAAAIPGARFLGWTGACTGAALSCSVLMSSAKAVTARFSPAVTLTLTSTPVEGGSVLLAPAGTACGPDCLAYPIGTAVTLTARPSADYRLKSWTGGACSGANVVCRLALNAPKTVFANFASTIIARIDITPPGATVMVGNHQNFIGTPKRMNGSVVTGVIVTWASSDSTIATIGTTGVAIALRPGVTNIAASAGGHTTTVTLTVQSDSPPPPCDPSAPDGLGRPPDGGVVALCGGGGGD